MYRSLRRRPWAIAAALLALAMLVVYLVIIASQDGDSVAEVLPWATLMGVAVVLALVSLLLRPRPARNTLVAAVVLLAAIGLISLASIGLGFLAVAGVAAAAAVEAGKLESADQRIGDGE